MKNATLLFSLITACLLSSCVAGRVDRAEDRYDRREDRRDAMVYTGRGDIREGYWDRRENVNDKLRGRRGL
ncbi:MAG: hypothetical protein JNJ83_14200 [Verrucomicrobiaceae bacterium]|nr:hypothetical protein [Verrucomicrobiaceae bacterium]